MVRSMYSGVVGMRAQQSAMDTIGNNIANVKTYGYKASRTTFKDVYYQTLKSGSAATGNRGGTNPSQIGYGAQLGSIDVLHGQSSFAMTGRSMDMAIAGEGFFQVMDGDGNTFFTRAGQMLFDPEGNLVDSNGNFVLGVSGDPLGKTGSSERIQLSIPPVNPDVSKFEELINSKTLKVKTTNPNKMGNVGLTFQSIDNMTAGKPCEAVVTGGGTGITIKLNSNYTFNTLADMQTAVNQAIKEANGGKEHPAGEFQFEYDSFPAGGLTGSEIVSKDYSVNSGTFTGWKTPFAGADMQISEVSSAFSGSGAVEMQPAEFVKGTAPALDTWEFEMAINGTTYRGSIDSNQLSKGTFLLKNTADPADTVTMTHPGFTKLSELSDTTGAVPPVPPVNGTTIGVDSAFTGVIADPSTPSKNIGFGSKVLKLTGGTEGGAQTPNNLDSIVIGADGNIIAKHAVHGEIPVGRIDIVTFANPQGLIQAGNTYFSQGPNAGKMNMCQPGADGAGELVTGSLEQSNVDLSQEFSDMITTQRAYQANSRMITVSDTMLEELVNLKR